MGLTDSEIVDEIARLIDRAAPLQYDLRGFYRVFDRVKAPDILNEIASVIQRARLLRRG
jgi:hypothetical protein